MVSPGFRWNRQGYYDFMRANAEAIASVIEATGTEIVDEANASLESPRADFVVDVELSSGRRRVPRVGLVAASIAARDAEKRNRVLTRAVERRRGATEKAVVDIGLVDELTALRRVRQIVSQQPILGLFDLAQPLRNFAFEDESRGRQDIV